MYLLDDDMEYVFFKFLFPYFLKLRLMILELNFNGCLHIFFVKMLIFSVNYINCFVFSVVEFDK